MFIELRHVALWWMLDCLRDILGISHGVVYNLRAPSVAELYAREIDCIATLLLADIDAITHYDGIDCLVYGVGDGVAV